MNVTEFFTNIRAHQRAREVVDKGAVSLVSARDGEMFATTFKEAPQQ